MILKVKLNWIAAKRVLDLAKNAKAIFMSSKLEEKQQLLGFFFSNLQFNAEKLDVELREPFKQVAKLHDQTGTVRPTGSTHGLQIRNLSLYPSELRAHTNHFISRSFYFKASIPLRPVRRSLPSRKQCSFKEHQAWISIGGSYGRLKY